MLARTIGLLFSLLVAGLSAVVSVLAGRMYIDAYEGTLPSRYFRETYYVLFAAVGMAAGFTVASLIYRQVVLSDLRRIPGRDKIAVVLGVFVGLGITSLAATMLIRIPRFGTPVVMLVGIVCVYLCVAIMLSMKEELYYFFPGLAARPDSPGDEGPARRPKLLDTNVIIDGRIADIAGTGFVEGPLLVPGFVLEELHVIADSADTLKRNRGRRGLDILNQMQQQPGVEVSVFQDYPTPPKPGEPVDARLVQLAKEMSAAIVTNDFNLNKVAQLQGVSVLNVNELANAVKPVVLPGEELSVTIVREGREPEQGVAYLDDGTMVVVEHGKDRIGSTIRIIVTSVLQTVAGKMIFGTPPDGGSGGQEGNGEVFQGRRRRRS